MELPLRHQDLSSPITSMKVPMEFFVYTLSRSGDLSAGIPFKDEDSITSSAVRVGRPFSVILGQAWCWIGIFGYLDDFTKVISHELRQLVFIANAHWHKEGFRVGHERLPFQCFDSGLQSKSRGGEVGCCCAYLQKKIGKTPATLCL